MSKKGDLKKAIEESEREIDELEKKRNRSQSALLDSFLHGTKPNDVDVEYFRIYSQLIEVERKNLRILREKLESM